MPRTTNFLTRQRKQITARLDELRPLYEEYLTLEKAQQALEELGEPVRRAVTGNGRRTRRSGRGPGRPRTGRKPGRPRGSGTRTTSKRTTARKSAGSRTTASRGATARRSTGRRRTGGRADQALAAIKSSPGITIPELAERLKVRPNYLYRVTQGLQRERRIRKRGRGFHAA